MYITKRIYVIRDRLTPARGCGRTADGRAASRPCGCRPTREFPYKQAGSSVIRYATVGSNILSSGLLTRGFGGSSPWRRTRWSSRFSRSHVHVRTRPRPAAAAGQDQGRRAAAFPRKRLAQLRAASPRVDWARLTCGQTPSTAAFAQVKVKREVLTARSSRFSRSDVHVRTRPCRGCRSLGPGVDQGRRAPRFRGSGPCNCVRRPPASGLASLNPRAVPEHARIRPGQSQT